jgi:hypothetical protein
MNHYSIACGGQGLRWNGDYPKHLATLGQYGETILGRLIRQIGRPRETVLLTENIMIQQQYLGQCWFPEKHRYLCETLMNTAHMWKERNYIFLGDAIISKENFEAFMNSTKSVTWLASQTDIFAVSFHDSMYHKMFSAFRGSAVAALDDAGRGKLWEAYRLFHSFQIDDHWFYTPDTIFISDWTMDVDTMDDYRRFLDKLDRGVIKLD